MIWSRVKLLYRLWRILQIEDVTVGDSTVNPLTGKSMSFTDRSELQHTEFQKLAVEMGMMRKVPSDKL